MQRSEDHRTFSAPDERGVEPSAEQAASDVWARVKRRLRAELGEDIFASWFGRLELDSVVESCAYLSVPTRFLKSWIESHYADRVLAVYRAEAPDVERVVIGVRNTLGREAAPVRRTGEPVRTTPAAPSIAGSPPDGDARSFSGRARSCLPGPSRAPSAGSAVSTWAWPPG